MIRKIINKIDEWKDHNRSQESNRLSYRWRWMTMEKKKGDKNNWYKAWSIYLKSRLKHLLIYFLSNSVHHLILFSLLPSIYYYHYTFFALTQAFASDFFISDFEWWFKLLLLFIKNNFYQNDSYLHEPPWVHEVVLSFLSFIMLTSFCFYFFINLYFSVSSCKQGIKVTTRSSVPRQKAFVPEFCFLLLLKQIDTSAYHVRDIFWYQIFSFFPSSSLSNTKNVVELSVRSDVLRKRRVFSFACRAWVCLFLSLFFFFFFHFFIFVFSFSIFSSFNIINVFFFFFFWFAKVRRWK